MAIAIRHSILPTNCSIAYRVTFHKTLMAALPDVPAFEPFGFDVDNFHKRENCGYPELLMYSGNKYIGSAHISTDGKVYYHWKPGGDGYSALGREKARVIREWMKSAYDTAWELSESAPRKVQPVWHTCHEDTYPPCQFMWIPKHLRCTKSPYAKAR